MSAIRKTFPAWPVDSSIHALGHIRDIASEQLKNADIVISTREPEPKMWQPWNLSQNYWFYENLLKGYYVFALSPRTVVWKKNEHWRLSKAIECKFNSDAQSIGFEIPVPGFYEVEINYRAIGEGRILIMLKNNINYAWDSDGYMSVNPKGTHTKFPVYFREAGPVHVDIKVIGNKGVGVEVKSCVASYLEFNEKDVLSPPPSTYQ